MHSQQRHANKLDLRERHCMRATPFSANPYQNSEQFFDNYILSCRRCYPQLNLFKNNLSCERCVTGLTLHCFLFPYGVLSRFCFLVLYFLALLLALYPFILNVTLKLRLSGFFFLYSCKRYYGWWDRGLSICICEFILRPTTPFIKRSADELRPLASLPPSWTYRDTIISSCRLCIHAFRYLCILLLPGGRHVWVKLTKFNKRLLQYSFDIE